MSRVFLVRDESLGRDIVVKLLPPDLAAEMSVERFTREIKLAAALQNPHVVPVLSAGVAAGLPYYAMPFIRGESLRGVIDKGGLPLEEALNVLRDLAKALRYAHGEGVVHRDIKPENVLMSSGSAVVTDFGIAKALSASRTDAPGGTLTVVGTSMGTPAYMSPEQAAADPNIDHRADIYAWGVIAYELLAKRHPFSGKTTAQQYLRAHLAEDAAPLRKVVPTLPASVADIVMKAIEKDPDNRPQSADEILTALGNLTSGATSGLSYAGKSLPWKIPAIAAAAIILMGAGYLTYRNRSAPSASGTVMLAVLPFENQGPPEQDYFVDGLTDAVNGKLASLSGMSVIDRRSTVLYKKTTKPVKQIGRELGVQFVLGGVVRWAKSSTGWRAQITPTLVNTSDATTRWAGDPLVVSSEDPFSAQTEIATKVASALQLALGADEKNDLAKRPTENTQAYDAFLRAKAIGEASERSAFSVRAVDQAIVELRRAVALDPNFASAWAHLSLAAFGRARAVPGDSASVSLAMRAAERANALDPKDPTVVLVRYKLAALRGDQKAAANVVTDALRAGVVSPEILIVHAFQTLDKSDSANAIIAQAIKLNPRYFPSILIAQFQAEAAKDFTAATRYARTLTNIDPTDERGWSSLGSLGRDVGDSAFIRSILEEAFRHIPAPSNLLLTQMVYAGGETGAKYIRMTPQQLRIETLPDSIGSYYDNKADYYLGRHDLPKARIYLDSIVAKLKNRDLSGPGEPLMRMYLANASAFQGRLVEARRELERAEKSALALHVINPDGTAALDLRMHAVVLAAIGDTVGAMGAVRKLVEKEAWTRAGLSIEPKMQALRGMAAYEAYLKEPEPHAKLN